MNPQKPAAISFVLAVGLTFVSLAMHACSSEAPDTTPPAPVTDLRVEAFTETTAVLVWTAPGDDGDRGQAAQYDLRVSTAPPPSDWFSAAPADADLAPPSKPGEPDSAVVRGLTFGATHTFALRTADDSDNWSVFSNTVEVETADSAPPGRVTDLSTSLPAPHAVTLVFTAPGDDSLSGTASAYEVRISPSPITEATWEGAQPVSVSGTPLPGGSQEHLRVIGLEPGSMIHLALRARDNVSRWSGVSNDVEATLPADTVPPGTIADLEVVETGTRTATLRWTAPGNDGDEAKVEGYEIRYAESRIEGEAEWQAAGSVQASVSIVPPGVTQAATVSGLPGPKTLWFAVRATDLAGNRGGLSNGASGFVERPQLTWLIRADGWGDAPTVQAGIDSAAVGDTVLVMPGRYYENLNFNGKNIVVRSQAGPEVTVLDGSHKRGSVVVFRSGEGRGAVIEGFTITGGVGELEGGTTDDYRGGGGILILDSTPVIRGNTVAKNTAGSWGGGILATGLAHGLTIEGNAIRENRARSNGGGVGLIGSGVIEGNLIEGNECDRGDGGGVWAWLPGYQISVSILDNRILGNKAGDHGGGVHCALGTPSGEMEIAGNLIAGNTAFGGGHVQFSGGGIWLYGGSYWVHHNTIVGNDARGYPDPSWGGGGIALVKAGPKLIENNLIAYSTYGGGIRCESVATFEIRNNLAWSNVGGDGNGLCADWTNMNGNLAADPLFCDQPGGDYSLAVNSPALLHPSGPIGAFPTAGCGATSAAATQLPIQGLWGGLVRNRAH